MGWPDGGGTLRASQEGCNETVGADPDWRAVMIQQWKAVATDQNGVPRLWAIASSKSRAITRCEQEIADYKTGRPDLILAVTTVEPWSSSTVRS